VSPNFQGLAFPWRVNYLGVGVSVTVTSLLYASRCLPIFKGTSVHGPVLQFPRIALSFQPLGGSEFFTLVVQNFNSSHESILHLPNLEIRVECFVQSGNIETLSRITWDVSPIFHGVSVSGVCTLPRIAVTNLLQAIGSVRIF